MNLHFGRRDRNNQEMDSSLTASLFLLSVVFMQFVSAAGQITVPVKAESGQKVTLPCEDPDLRKIQFVEWKRTDLGSKYVLLYRDDRITTDGQHPSYKDRVELVVYQLTFADASLILKNVTITDSGTYECRVKLENSVEIKVISTVNLDVLPPDLFPVWAIVLLVLLVLVLALVAAAGVSFYSWQHWKPVQQVEVESGTASVLLPLKVPRFPWFCIFRLLQVDKVEWRDGDNRTVHVNQNGHNQPEEQNQFYRTRTRMDENLLKTGDLSLTLLWPSDGDSNIYTCSVYNRKGDKLMKKRVQLKVKDPEQVVVKSGEESVLLPCRTTESLDGDTKVEWRDKYDRKVHVYQNGSDQPGEQDQFYRTRTKMDENLLKTKDLSLTLSWPKYEDEKTYTCRVYNRKGDVLMMKQVQLKVKAQEQVEVKSVVESVLLPCRTTESLDGHVRVEWVDSRGKKVHMYQNGSDQPGEQDQIYRTRTRMDGNLLKTKDLSLTLSWPTFEDEKTYICSVYRDGVLLMEKRVWLKVIAQEQVEVELGEESVLLPCRTTEDLDGDVRVVWMDAIGRKVHVNQNGSDQPREKNQVYKDRTRMDENLLKTKDLSLTLRRPTEGDGGIYSCRVYSSAGVVLMMKQVDLQVKAGTDQDQPEDIMEPLLADQSV